MIKEYICIKPTRRFNTRYHMRCKLSYQTVINQYLICPKPASSTREKVSGTWMRALIIPPSFIQNYMMQTRFNPLH